MNASLSDEYESNHPEDSKEKNVSFMAFIASVKSIDDASDYDPPVLIETCDEESQGESDGEINFQKAYN